MKPEEQREFEKHLRKYLMDLFERRLEYEEAQTDKVVNPNGENTDYFRGKHDAYGYAHSQLVGIFKWYGLEL